MKQIIDATRTREIIKSAVNQLVLFIIPTFGPANNNIIIRSFGEPQAVDDGVSVVKSFALEDPAEQMIIELVREVALKTSNRVKDGTTTSMILLREILNNSENIDLAELKSEAREVVNYLKVNAQAVESVQDLTTVARTAYNNPVIADAIAVLAKRIGKEGIITIEEANGLEMEYTATAGIKFDSGYASQYMITDTDKQEAMLQNVPILITDQELKEARQITPIVKKIIDAGKGEMLIIADSVSDEVLSFVIANKLKGKFNATIVLLPERGDRRKEFANDLCAVTGATIISSLLADKIEQTELEQLGFADKVIMTRDDTTIIGGAGKRIEERAKYYRDIIKSKVEDNEKNKAIKSLAKLTGSIGVIKVGANTNQEVKSLLPKIENVANSVMSAYKHGVIQGGGIDLYGAMTTNKALDCALKAPANLLPHDNTVILDSVEVITTAIDSAVSIACLLINSKGMIVDNN